MHMSHYATMVNCLLEDTSKSTVNLLQLRVHICSTIHSKQVTYQFVLILPFTLTSPFLVYRYIRISLIITPEALFF